MAMSNLAEVRTAMTVEDAYARYHAAWEAQDADRIADLHSADSIFWLQDGKSPLVQGREPIRRHCAGLFQLYGEIGFEPCRVLYGEDRWVFDYTMVLKLADTSGKPFIARIDMIDVVDVNPAGEVTRKDVFVDRAAAQEALARAGLA